MAWYQRGSAEEYKRCNHPPNPTLVHSHGANPIQTLGFRAFAKLSPSFRQAFAKLSLSFRQAFAKLSLSFPHQKCARKAKQFKRLNFIYSFSNIKYFRNIIIIIASAKAYTLGRGNFSCVFFSFRPFLCKPGHAIFVSGLQKLVISLYAIFVSELQKLFISLYLIFVSGLQNLVISLHAIFVSGLQNLVISLYAIFVSGLQNLLFSLYTIFVSGLQKLVISLSLIFISGLQKLVISL